MKLWYQTISFDKASLLLFLIVGGACVDTEEAEKSVDYWHPRSRKGLAIRCLPPAGQLYQDYYEWMKSTPGRKSRIYRGKFFAGSQLDLKAYRTQGNTGLGDYTYTTVAFDYNDSSNGTYRIHWEGRGTSYPQKLKLREDTVFLLQPSAPRENGKPRLLVVGIEGVPSHRGVPLRDLTWFEVSGVDVTIRSTEGSSIRGGVKRQKVP